MKIFKKYNINGLIEYELFNNKDQRGDFTKVWKKLNLKKFNVKEVYCSSSIKGVIRGMHFQVPPYECSKFVYCLEGRIHDIVIDLRKKEKTFMLSQSINLSSKKNHAILIPAGLAHGFQCLSENCKVLYLSDQVYSRRHDKGIYFNSINTKWPIKNFKVSSRDKLFDKLINFNSPF